MSGTVMLSILLKDRGGTIVIDLVLPVVDLVQRW